MDYHWKYICPLLVVILVVLIIRTRSNYAFEDIFWKQLLGSQRPSVALIVTHPDDAAIFFTPLVEYMKSSVLMRKLEVVIDILFISNDAHTLSVKVDTSDIANLCNKYAKNCAIRKQYEGLTEEKFWEPSFMAEYVELFLKKTGTNFVITLDNLGDSGSPTHAATYAAIEILKQRMADLKVWSLRSFGSVLRYIAPLATIRSFFAWPVLAYGTPFEIVKNLALLKLKYSGSDYLWALLWSYSYISMFKTLH